MCRIEKSSMVTMSIRQQTAQMCTEMDNYGGTSLRTHKKRQSKVHKHLTGSGRLASRLVLGPALALRGLRWVRQ